MRRRPALPPELQRFAQEVAQRYSACREQSMPSALVTVTAYPGRPDAVGMCGCRTVDYCLHASGTAAVSVSIGTSWCARLATRDISSWSAMSDSVAAATEGKQQELQTSHRTGIMPHTLRLARLRIRSKRSSEEQDVRLGPVAASLKPTGTNMKRCRPVDSVVYPAAGLLHSNRTPLGLVEKLVRLDLALDVCRRKDATRNRCESGQGETGQCSR